MSNQDWRIEQQAKAVLVGAVKELLDLGYDYNLIIKIVDAAAK